MKSKRAAEGDARERILAAAQRLFAERGFEGASTKAIAAAAGVPSGLVFYYFPTKEQLIDAVFEQNVATDMLSIFESVAPSNSKHEELASVLHRLFRWLAEHRDQAYILMGEIASKRPIAKRLREIRSAALESLARFLIERDMIDAGSGVDAHVVAQAVSAALVFATVLDRPADEEEYIRRLAAMVVRPHGLSS